MSDSIATAAAGISADTDSDTLTAYQQALVSFYCGSTLEQIHKVAKRNGWNAKKLAADVWQELYDPSFKPWLAVPKLAQK